MSNEKEAKGYMLVIIEKRLGAQTPTGGLNC